MKKFGGLLFLRRFVIVGIALLGPLGCKRANPPSTPASTTAKDANKTAAVTALEVRVEPPTGIAIWLDGEKIAEAAPFTTTQITPGPHTLLVRGMGFYPITLPIEVQAGATLHVPVALRARPLGVYDGPVASGVAQEPAAHAEPTKGPLEHHLGEPAHGYPELPHGMNPIEIAVTAQPPAPITIDGHSSDGRSVRLGHLKGELSIGSITFKYEMLPGSVVELPIPTDGASWFKSEQQLKGASIIKFSHGTIHVRRATPKGEQNVSIRRID